MKVISMKIKKMALVASSMPMEIFIQANFLKIKNTGKVRFIGLACVLLHAQNKLVSKLSSIMEIGGGDSLMAKDNIKRRMVSFHIIQGIFMLEDSRMGSSMGMAYNIT